MKEKKYSKEHATTSDVQVDFQAWVSKLLSHWWLFLLCLLIAVPAGQIYLRYTTYEYSAKAKVLIKGVGRSGTLSESGILADNFGISGGSKDMNNEIEILMSRPIMTKTIDRINADITYYRQGNIKNTELFNASPILVDSFELNEDYKLPFSFFVEMGYYNDFGFSKKEGKGERYEFGKPFKNAFGTFLITRNEKEKLVPGMYQINLFNSEDVAAHYKNKLVVEIVGAQGSSSILELKLIDPSPNKAQDLLDALIQVYNEEEINDETQVLKNTIDFIDERMLSLSRELNTVESDIASFKSDNEIVTQDALSSSSFALGELRNSFATLSDLEVERELLKALQDRLVNPKYSNLPIPPNVASTNIALSRLIEEYNTLFLQQKKLKETVTEQSPLIVNNGSRLQDIKELIVVTLRDLQNDLEIPIASTRLEIDRLKQSMTAVPNVEKELLEKQRMQAIKENLFLFLLQRKEETELSKAITTGKIRIVENAKSSRGPVYPQKKLILLATILLGFLVPIVIVALRSLFEMTVGSEDMLKGMTDIPVVGRVVQNKTREKIIIKPGERSANSEMFRSIRTNLNYMINKDKQVFLVTSSVSGEGKSVIALNLALSFAMSKKKVVLVGMDLRRPKVTEYLGEIESKGVTDYLSGQAELDDIVNTYKDHENFHYISCGIIPPNPAELIMSDKMGELIEELKGQFDSIILDTPPVVVTDAFLLREYITNTLLVVRHKYTRKEMVRHLDDLNRKKEFVKPSIIYNGVVIRKKYHGFGRYNPYDGAGYYINEG